LSALILAGFLSSQLQRRRRRGEEHDMEYIQTKRPSEDVVISREQEEQREAALQQPGSGDAIGTNAASPTSSSAAPRRGIKSAEAEAAAAAAAAAIDAALAGWELREAPTVQTSSARDAATAPESAASTSSAREWASQVSVKNPEGLADMLIECLVHIGDEAPGTPEALAYDMGGLLNSKLEAVKAKLSLKKIQKLFSADSIQLRSASLVSFDALVISRVLRSHNKKVECLDLGSNQQIGPAGAGHLAEHVLRRDYPLMSLTLSGCGLMNSGVIALADSLPHSSTLEILELCHNGVSDGCVSFLCRALEANASLQSLFLNNDKWCPPERQNRITDEGAAQFAQVLSAGRDVKISLQLNAISCERQADLRRMAGGNLLRL